MRWSHSQTSTDVEQTCCVSSPQIDSPQKNNLDWISLSFGVILPEKNTHPCEISEYTTWSLLQRQIYSNYEISLGYRNITNLIIYTDWISGHCYKPIMVHGPFLDAFSVGTVHLAWPFCNLNRSHRMVSSGMEAIALKKWVDQMTSGLENKGMKCWEVQTTKWASWQKGP